MSVNQWQEVYKKTVNNEKRNFDMGGDIDYRICNIYCNFDVTNLDEKDYIQGITATGSSNLLHINPLVNTKPPQKALQSVGVFSGDTVNREKNVSLNYNFSSEGAIPEKYKLIDIFFRLPSKVVLSGKRYPLEVCQIFASEDQSRYVVCCVPMKVDSNNNTTDPLKKDLYEILMSIASNFPTKGKTYSIENAPNWNPLVFFPIKTGDNASFYTWLDPTTNNSVMYVQFRNPISVPYKFYESFANRLGGGIKKSQQTVGLPANPEFDGLEIFYNKNEADKNIGVSFECKKITNPKLQEMVNFAKITGENDRKKQEEKKKENENKPKCNFVCKKNNIWRYLFTGLVILLFLIGLLISGYFLYKYYKKRTSIPNNPQGFILTNNSPNSSQFDLNPNINSEII